MRLPHLPLYVRVLIGVVLGSTVGLIFGTGEIVLGATTEHLNQLGILVIRLLKMLAVPLVLFAILDAIARTEVSGRMGGRLIVICLFNVSIAFTIGLILMNTIQPGLEWEGRISEITGMPGLGEMKQAPAGTSLSPLDNFAKWIPETAVQPFAENNVIAVVLFAILIGAALRKTMRTPATADAGNAVAKVVEGGYHMLMLMLTWVVEIVPFAVFGVVAFVVGKAGLDAFSALWGFLLVILLGFTIHAGGYYVLMAWIVGRKSPRVYLGKGANAIITGLSTNSSLATVPVTLDCLDKMGVSQESARLSACIGTNLNNDGITLYEAMAALFLAQGLGYDLSLSAQLTIVAASMMAGIGIAGVPEAGLIVLPLVLSAAGLPEPVVAAMIPVVFVVDWILARCRTVVNVMSDMLVAILLERWRRNDKPEQA
ncbi:MAG: dicarboxylate/amino acid:cation symporter [Deltaproteobacteria bacterium]|nr:dicarboxylate/amino acid:cation symporter [Deltaproteobacteria bacterium]